MYLFCLHSTAVATQIRRKNEPLDAEKISNISDVMRISRRMSNNLKTSVKVKALFIRDWRTLKNLVISFQGVK